MSHKIIKWDCEVSSSLKAEPLLDGGFSKEIRINMPKGSKMHDHHAPFPIIVQVLRGELLFGVGGQEFCMKDFDMISLQASEVHNLEAKTDCLVRLSLYKDDSFTRVADVVS